MNSYRIHVHPQRSHAAVKVGFAWPALAFGPAWLIVAGLRARAAALALALLAAAGFAGWIDRMPAGAARTAGAFGIGLVALGLAGWAGARGNRWQEGRLSRRGYTPAGQVNAPSAPVAVGRWMRTVGADSSAPAASPERVGGRTLRAAGSAVCLGCLLVVAFIAGGRLEALAGLDRTLHSEPLPRELARAAPDLYGQVRARSRAAAARGADVSLAAAETGRALTPEIVRRFLPTASDSAVAGFERARLDEIEELRSQSADSAFRIAFPRPGDASPSTGEDDARDREEAALAEVVRTGAGRRPPPPDTARARQLLDGLTAAVAHDHAAGLAALGDPHRPGTDPAQAVDAYVALHEVILAQPLPDAALLLRFIDAR